MLSLLKASDIVRIGLTCTQTFFLVGKNINKKLCRFVKTDSVKTAISTLLAIEGQPCLVEDIRMTDLDGLRVWTNQGVKELPPAKVRCFLARYNQLSREGCSSKCNCQNELWSHFCIHKIAEHLTCIKEKVSAILQFAKKTVKQLVEEVTSRLAEEKLEWHSFNEDGDSFFQVQNYGCLIVSSQAEIFVISPATGSRESKANNIDDAFELLKSSEFCLPFYFITSSSDLCAKGEGS